MSPSNLRIQGLFSLLMHVLVYMYIHTCYSNTLTTYAIGQRVHVAKVEPIDGIAAFADGPHNVTPAIAHLNSAENVFKKML